MSSKISSTSTSKTADVSGKETRSRHREAAGWRKVCRYLGYVLRDVFRFAPGILCGIIMVAVIDCVMQIWNPLLIAEIFEVVPDLNPSNMKIFARDIIFLCLTVGMPQMGMLLTRMAEIYLTGRKEQCYGWKMFEHAKKIRLEALENPGILDTFQKAEAAYGDQEAVNYLLAKGIMGIEDFVACIGMLYVAAKFSVWLIPGAIIGFVPHFIITVKQERFYTNVYRRQTILKRRLQYLWRQFCQKEAVKEMRVLGFGEYLKQKWVETNVEVVRDIQKVELKALKRNNIGNIIKNACYAANIAIALLLMVRGQLAVGQFAACLSAFATLQTSLLMLGGDMGDIFFLYRRVEEYYDFFEIETEQDGTKEYTPFQKEITLLDVHFRYSGSDRDSLNGVNLKINKGEHIVIVGVNGSGKTTLSKVLTGAYVASSGTVAYDGQEVQSFIKSSLYRDISLVPQDFVHYNFTMRENICISDLKYRNDDKRLNRTIEAVEMQELVQGIGGVDSQLGREFGGRELSGGEWQKVAIARGLFKDSGLIILDEPTSALDPLVEYDILTKFLELIRDKTSIIISHRVGICRSADKIVVMKDGRVVECGTHEELQAAGGEYSRIWEEQAKWY